MIAAGAIDRHLQVTPYSAKGADLDLVAPGGSEVDGSCSAGIWILGTGDSLICKIGTSFAAPHVSGVIALMLSAGFPQDPEKVRALLHMTARRPDDRPGRDASYGYGRLDALGAVASGIPRVMLVQPKEAACGLKLRPNRGSAAASRWLTRPRGGGASSVGSTSTTTERYRPATTLARPARSPSGKGRASLVLM